MKGALIHGALLVVMLVYGYRTWTRDKTTEPNRGDVVLWEKTEADLVSIEYKSDRKDVKIERRGTGGDAYWWGTDTTTEKKVKAPPIPPAPPNPHMGSGAGSGSAATKPGDKPAGAGSGSAATKPGDKPAGAGSGSAAKPADKPAGAGSASPVKPNDKPLPPIHRPAGSAAPRPPGTGGGPTPAMMDKDGSGNGSAAKPADKAGSAAKPADKAGSAAKPAAAGSGSAAKPADKAAGSGSAAKPADKAAGSAAKPDDKAAGSGSAVKTTTLGATPAAGSGAGSGSASMPAVPAPEEETKKTREFPLGDAGDKLIKSLVNAHALRDLGVLSEEAKKEYKLNDSKATLTITFKDGAHTFVIGNTTNTDVRYVMEQTTGKGYVFVKDMVAGLELGESSLHLIDPRGFELAKIESVTIEAGGKSKTAVRVQTGVEGQQVKTWGDADTKKADQTVANFIDNANNLKPSEYSSQVKIDTLTYVLRLVYKDERGNTLGTLTLYKREKPGEIAQDQDLDPANPPKGEIEYYVVTEKSKVPGLVRKDTAQRTEQDIVTVFSDHPTGDEGAGSGSGGKKSIDPHGNPFGPGAPRPGAPPHKAPPHMGSGAPPATP